MKILIILLLIFNLSILSQEEEDDNVLSPQEEETTNTEEESTPILSDDFTDSSSIEIKGGVYDFKSNLKPGFGLLFQKSFSSNWDLGLSFKSIFVEKNVDRTLSINNPTQELTINPLTFSATYLFYRDSSFQPFMRFQGGFAFIHNSSARSNGLTLSLSGGGRYFLNDSLFLLGELGINRFELKELKDNIPFVDFGVGISF